MSTAKGQTESQSREERETWRSTSKSSGLCLRRTTRLGAGTTRPGPPPLPAVELVADAAHALGVDGVRAQETLRGGRARVVRADRVRVVWGRRGGGAGRGGGGGGGGGGGECDATLPEGEGAVRVDARAGEEPVAHARASWSAVESCNDGREEEDKTHLSATTSASLSSLRLSHELTASARTPNPPCAPSDSDRPSASLMKGPRSAVTG